MKLTVILIFNFRIYHVVNVSALGELEEALCDVVEQILAGPLHQLLADGVDLVVHVEPGRICDMLRTSNMLRTSFVADSWRKTRTGCRQSQKRIK